MSSVYILFFKVDVILIYEGLQEKMIFLRGEIKSIYTNILKCSDRMDEVSNSYDVSVLAGLPETQINEINVILMNINGALNRVKNLMSGNFLT